MALEILEIFAEAQGNFHDAAATETRVRGQSEGGGNEPVSREQMAHQMFRDDRALCRKLNEADAMTLREATWQAIRGADWLHSEAQRGEEILKNLKQKRLQRKHNSVAPELKNEVIRLLNERTPVTQIVRTLGAPSHTVYRIRAATMRAQ